MLCLRDKLAKAHLYWKTKKTELCDFNHAIHFIVNSFFVLSVNFNRLIIKIKTKRRARKKLGNEL